MKNTLTQEYIDGILKKSSVKIETVFDKCTVVSVQLPNGFIIVESSACADPENYDEKLGANICMERIKNQIWLMEGYQLNTHLHLARTLANKERMRGR